MAKKEHNAVSDPVVVVDRGAEATEPVLMDPRARREASIVWVTLDDGTSVMARRQDMTSMLFEGMLPMPMLAAIQKIVGGKGDMADKIMDSKDSDREIVVATLRKHACVVVIQPKVTEEDDGNPEHLPVVLLTVDELMRIWAATAMKPRVAADKAATFRGKAAGALSDAVQPRQDVRPSPQHVAGVEFSGQ